MTMIFQNLSVVAKSVVVSVLMITFCSLTDVVPVYAEEDFEKTVEEFKEIKSSTGFAPSLNDYIRLVIDDKRKSLSASEQID